jgi:ABC-type branched-subunit amino acid transport system permease subunit
MIVFGVLLVLACSFSPQGLVRQSPTRQKRAS